MGARGEVQSDGQVRFGSWCIQLAQLDTGYLAYERFCRRARHDAGCEEKELGTLRILLLAMGRE